jgi:hypothetical protein
MRSSKKAKKQPKPIPPTYVDKKEFESAIDALLRAKPLPKEKVKADKRRVPEPMFPAKS